MIENGRDMERNLFSIYLLLIFKEKVAERVKKEER